MDKIRKKNEVNQPWKLHMADEVSGDVVSVVDITWTSPVSSLAQQLHSITIENRNVLQFLTLVKTLKNPLISPSFIILHWPNVIHWNN